MKSYEPVVIGAGPNGLAAAVALALFGEDDESRAACFGWSRWSILASIEPDAAAHLATVRSHEREKKVCTPSTYQPRKADDLARSHCERDITQRRPRFLAPASDREMFNAK
jgi:hypothetical protein